MDTIDELDALRAIKTNLKEADIWLESCSRKLAQLAMKKNPDDPKHPSRQAADAYLATNILITDLRLKLQSLIINRINTRMKELMIKYEHE